MTVPYSSIRYGQSTPRLPIEGNFDLTYRCNNNCRHCWLRITPNAPEQNNELSFDEIRRIADEARAMGTHIWNISGGEPMLRPDFLEIFDYLSRKATNYSLNTNGTLITPKIAQFLKRKGNKMIALYGATAKTYDHVARHQGAFELAMRGFQYMQEAGAAFTVQLVPLRDNWLEWEQMQALAKSLSPYWRVGAPWLYMSANGNPTRNAEIDCQRLDSRTVIELDTPDMSQEGAVVKECKRAAGDNRLFASCIASGHGFHMDPYGGITFCTFIKDPTMRYDTLKGSFQYAWETFIPSLADRVIGREEYAENCAECKYRDDCYWCPVYSYLEHKRYTAPVKYLCNVAHENRRFKENWLLNHRRYYRIAEITIQVDSDLPITDATFNQQIELFRVDGPGEDMVSISHHFGLPNLVGRDLGKELYRKTPWAIYHKDSSWIYLGISSNDKPETSVHQIATFNIDHTRSQIYNKYENAFIKGSLHSLTMFPSDQILISRLLIDRNGCCLHSAGAILNGMGILFVGHSESGKSTITKLLIDAGERPSHDVVGKESNLLKLPAQVEILCDDRNIIRKYNDGWRVSGTWSHGEVPVVSPSSAPLRAICFIEKAEKNNLESITDHKEIMHRLLACIIKPFITADWWYKTLNLVEQAVREVPFYILRFQKNVDIMEEMRNIITISAMGQSNSSEE
jgi:radical SAM protein with 4Fe4S-binding SPASM domain